MNVAICDDNINYGKLAENYIREIVGPRRALNIDIFLSGQKLLESINDKTYDIVFLDIEMPGINGIEVAQRLREKDKSVIIAFLTNYSEFATKGYEVSAFRYILKEEPESMIKRQVQSIVNEYYRKQKCLVANIKGVRITIKISSIIYLEVMKRVIYVHTASGKTYQFYSTLNNMLSRLEGFGFVKTHQSYVVNMSFIESIHVNSVVLKTGQSIPLSRVLKREVETAYVSYLASL
ncbi:MAG TPA: LytTR family DNA-binding domain-containing protein [Clostridia bacterium]|nr:LytTR family DNA-binding domain-containing protein [Clostridia bacterium]